ncbi:hypothetical protein QTP86_007379 [Hemibagrus guttatus]|nr:hypothetical protein QTP86_007379 [Hemibagrus guttatus]
MFKVVVVFYCLVVLPVKAKQDNLRVITDGNWEEILTGEWMIEFCKDGVFRRYQGARTKEDFLSFVDEKKWQNIEPISSWFGPSSIMAAFLIKHCRMNMMSALFKLSMFIRQCHTYLTEQVGIPVWGSYIIFGLVTLFSGLTLGLVLVFFADFVFPSRRFSSSAYYQKKHAMEQARLRHQLEDEQEADGEEEEDEDEYVGSVEEWSREGVNEDAVRKRAVGRGEENDTYRPGEEM